MEEREGHGEVPTHLFCVLWPLHRKQELANSSDVTLPDQPLSPPLTAPPTMKVRDLGSVIGEEQWAGKVLLLWPQAQLLLSSGSVSCPHTSGGSVHLRLPVWEDSVTVRFRGVKRL